MYEYIKGKYIGINKDYIIVENNGIGYRIFTSGATMSAMPASGEEVKLYLEQIVREDFIGLYGFETNAIVSMDEIIDYLIDKKVIDDELKSRLDAYYKEYGVRA